MNWKNQIEKISPNALLEIPDVGVYKSNLDTFILNGFTPSIFAKILPLSEEQIWSTFALWQLSKKTNLIREAHLLEIGSGKGGSILTMGLANLTAELWNVDAFKPFDEESAFGRSNGYQGFSYIDFKNNLRPTMQVFERVKTVLQWSEEAVNEIPENYFDLIFIDGNHSYENCKQDILNYTTKLRSDGIMCGHDYHPRFPGVISAVKELYGEQFDVMEFSSVWVKI